MYRQHVHDRVNGEDVVDFLLRDERFPRAVAHCLNMVHACSAELPKNDLVIHATASARRMVTGEDVLKIYRRGRLHKYIDDVQLELARIHEQLRIAWFGFPAPNTLPVPATQKQTSVTA